MFKRVLFLFLFVANCALAQQIEMQILSGPSANNRYPGNDGLVGNADDVVSSNLTPTQGSAPNAMGSYGLNAFDFGGPTTDNELPTGFNAITFISGNITVDQGVLTNGGGPIITALDITNGTEPFVGHGAYTATATSVNSGNYDPATQQFMLNIDISFLINGNTATEPGLVLTGTALMLDSSEFGAGSGNAYVDTVLVPLAQGTGASSLAFFDGTGMLPNLGFPIRFVIAATASGNSGFNINQGIAGAWFNPDTAGQGFLIDIDPTSQFIFVAWFTYEQASAKVGAPEHRWLTAQGTYSGNSAELPVFVTTGGLFDNPQGVVTGEDGSLTISFTDCSNGLVQYDLPEDGLQGQIPIIRVIPGTEDLCDTLVGSR